MSDLAQIRTAEGKFVCDIMPHKALTPRQQHLMTEAPPAVQFNRGVTVTVAVPAMLPPARFTVPILALSLNVADSSICPTFATMTVEGRTTGTPTHTYTQRRRIQGRVDHRDPEEC